MTFRFLNAIACLGSLAAFCLQSSQAEAIFASVKSTGMAATAISYPLDTLCGAYNPAGESYIEDRVDVEAGWLHDWGHARTFDNAAPNPNPPPANLPPDNPITNGTFQGMRTKDVYPVTFGINKNWCLCGDWEASTALIIYNRNFQKTTYNQFLPLFGTSHAGLEYLNETVSPIVSIKWCNTQSIGISANYQIERIKVNGLQNFDKAPTPLSPVGSVAPGHVTNRGYDWSTGWGFTIGYLGRFFCDNLAVGVTYQPKTSMSKLTKYKGFLAQRGKLDIPAKIGAGISYRVLPCLVVAFDYEFIQWSKIPALHNPILPKNALLPTLLGANDGPGFGFIDQNYYRLGVEWMINDCWTARVGFRHANTPIKRSQTAVNVLTLDTVEDFLTIGGTWNMTPCSEISFLYAYGFQKKVKGKDSIPALFGGGETNLQEQKYALGVAFGWKF